jgi:hypothetical protein
MPPWPKGVSGNIKGRKPGSRNRVSEAVTALFEEVIEQNGKESLERLHDKHPETFWRIASGFVPSKVEREIRSVSLFADLDMQDQQQFLEAYQLARSVIKGETPVIDVTPERVESPSDPEAEPTDE